MATTEVLQKVRNQIRQNQERGQEHRNYPRKIAQDTDLSRRHVHEALQELEDLDAVNRWRDGQKHRVEAV